MPSHRPTRALVLLAMLLAAGLSVLPAAAQNGVMMQYFHWYLDKNDNLWQQVAQEAPDLASAGITALWLPPATKAVSVDDVGYGVYDLYDLGEFNQKGTVRTKYGTRAEYLAAIQAAHQNGLQVYADVVFNHKGGADATEWVDSVRVQSGNRNNEYGGTVWIQAWTSFTFPGRGDTYSAMDWHWYHFDGVDYAANLPSEAGTIYKFRGAGKAWDWEVSSEFGNYDYLLYADLDFSHPEVTAELKSWGEWIVGQTDVDGFRLDAVKHIRFDWWPEWLDYVRTATGEPLFTVAEYWSYDVNELHNFLTETQGTLSAFDAPLHINFFNASHAGGSYDMRTLMDNTLMQQQPALAVTVVENHDTQPLQALQSPVMDWFKPLAYAFILLRSEGYPCVFYADYYGASYTDGGTTINLPSHQAILDVLLGARRDFAYGPQNSYLDHWDVIGWTRLGDASHPRAMAVILSDGPGGSKWMDVARPNATFTDITGHYGGTVTTNSSGWGQFPVNGGSVSVWVQDAAAPAQAAVHFSCANGYTVFGQNVYVVGSIPQLGSWSPASAVKLDPNSYPTWDKVIGNLPASTYVEWKCIKIDDNGTVIQWQAGANNTLTTPASGQVSASASF